MVRSYAETTTVDIPFRILCPVYFLRYPNPLATHVLSVDVLSREIVTRPRAIASAVPPSSGDAVHVSEAEFSSSTSFLGGWRFRGGGGGSDKDASTDVEEDVQHVLKTTRLILKQGTLPKWAPAGILRNTESWVLEETEVDLDDDGSGAGRQMRCWTRNMDHTTVMAVTERNVFHEPVVSKKKGSTPMTTRLDSHYDVESGLSFTLLRGRVEKFGYNRVVTHVDSSRQGLLSTYARFLDERAPTGALAGFPTLLRAHQRSQAGTAAADGGDGKGGVVSSRRARLLAAFRPPFLDGDFVGPIARLRRRAQEVRVWWKGLRRGGTADKQHMRVPRRAEEGAVNADEDVEAREELDLTPMERLRQRFLTLRDGPQHLHPTYNPAPGSDPSQG